MKTIFDRRSVRFYLDKPVEREKLVRLCEAGMQAPSGMNRQPWSFIVVTDAAMREKLGALTKYSGPAGRAPAVLVLLAEMAGISPEGAWQQDMAACTQNILLEAVDQGLGAVWIGVAPGEENMAKTRQLFDLPGDVNPFALVAVGYSDGTGLREPDRDKPERIHFETYSR